MSLARPIALAAAGLVPAAAATASWLPQDAIAVPATRTLRELRATVGLQDLTRGVQDAGFAWAFREARVDARGAWVWTEGRRSFAATEARWWTRDEIVERSAGATRGEDRVEAFDLTSFEHASWSRAAGDARGDVLLQFVRQPDRLWWTLHGCVDPRLGGAVARDVRALAGGRTELRFTNLGGVESELAFGGVEAGGWFELVVGHARGSFHVLTGPPARVGQGARAVPAWVIERETRDGAVAALVVHVLLGPAQAEEHVVPAGAAVMDFRRAGAAVQSQALDRPTPLVEVGWNGPTPAPRRLEPARASFALAPACDEVHDASVSPSDGAASPPARRRASEPPLVLADPAWKPSDAGERLLDEAARSGLGLRVGRFESPCPAREDGRHVVTPRDADGAATEARWAVGPDLVVPWLTAVESPGEPLVCSGCSAPAAGWPAAARADAGRVERIERPRARVRAPAELVLRRSPGLDRPAGTLVLAAEPAGDARPSLVGFESGCGLALRGTLPIGIPAEGVAVEFEASATRSFDPGPQGLASLQLDAGPPVRVAVRVLDLDPPCRLVPASIDLTRDAACEVAIEVRGGDAVAIRDLVAPGCVRIEVAHACARRVRLRVSALDDARRRHTCGPVVGLVERRGHPPFTLVARIEHGPLPRAGADATPLHVVVEPEAGFVLAQDGAGRTRVLHPGRAPGIGGWVDALGWQVLAQSRWGEDGLVLEPAQPDVVLPAVDTATAAELATYRDAWTSGG